MVKIVCRAKSCSEPLMPYITCDCSHVTFHRELVGLQVYHTMHKARRMLHTVGQLTRSHFVTCSFLQGLSTTVLSSLALSASYIIAVRHSQARWVTIPNDMSSYVRVFDRCYLVTVELYCNCPEQLHLCIDQFAGHMFVSHQLANCSKSYQLLC